MLNQRFKLQHWEGMLLHLKAELLYQKGDYPAALVLNEQALQQEVDQEVEGTIWQMNGQI